MEKDRDISPRRTPEPINAFPGPSPRGTNGTLEKRGSGGNVNTQTENGVEGHLDHEA